MYASLSFAVFVAAVAAVDRSEFTINTLLKRQEGTSGPQYQCHSDCGNTILDASADTCEDSAWNDLLSNCQECANTYNILRYYGDSVESAAEGCELTVTWSPSEGASSESAPAQTSSTTASSSAVTHTESSTITSAPPSFATTATSTTASGSILPSSPSNTSSIATGLPSPSAVEESEGAGAKLVASLTTAIAAGLAFVVMV